MKRVKRKLYKVERNGDDTKTLDLNLAEVTQYQAKGFTVTEFKFSSKADK